MSIHLEMGRGGSRLRKVTQASLQASLSRSPPAERRSPIPPSCSGTAMGTPTDVQRQASSSDPQTFSADPFSMKDTGCTLNPPVV